jgi:hypothetical protein
MDYPGNKMGADMLQCRRPLIGHQVVGVFGLAQFIVC